MLQSGMHNEVANNYVSLGRAIREGKMQADYWKSKSGLGKVKLEEFVKEFAAAYNS
jgi:hypothetical protein